MNELKWKWIKFREKTSLSKQKGNKDWEINWINRNTKETQVVYLNQSKDIVYVSTWYNENDLLKIYQSFIHKWFANPIFMLCCLSITNLIPIDCQWFTNATDEIFLTDKIC